jgi:hypothetical protein
VRHSAVTLLLCEPFSTFQRIAACVCSDVLVAKLRNVDAYVDGRDAAGVALFRRFEEIVRDCGPSQVNPSRTIVYWKRNRVFAGAFIERKRLELNVDLLREADHPCLLKAFPTNNRVVTHRLRITEPEQIDGALVRLVREAYDEVGPGTG